MCKKRFTKISFTYYAKCFRCMGYITRIHEWWIQRCAVHIPFSEGLCSSCWSVAGRQPLAVSSFGCRELLIGSHPTEVRVQSFSHLGSLWDNSDRRFQLQGSPWGWVKLWRRRPLLCWLFPLPSLVALSPSHRGLSQGHSLIHILNAKLCFRVYFL